MIAAQVESESQSASELEKSLGDTNRQYTIWHDGGEWLISLKDKEQKNCKTLKEWLIGTAYQQPASPSPQPFTGEMWSFLLVNALRCLNEEQRAGLCFDLYCRNSLTESIDKRIEELKVSAAPA